MGWDPDLIFCEQKDSSYGGQMDLVETPTVWSGFCCRQKEWESDFHQFPFPLQFWMVLQPSGLGFCFGFGFCEGRGREIGREERISPQISSASSASSTLCNSGSDPLKTITLITKIMGGRQHLQRGTPLPFAWRDGFGSMWVQYLYFDKACSCSDLELQPGFYEWLCLLSFLLFFYYFTFHINKVISKYQMIVPS